MKYQNRWHGSCVMGDMLLRLTLLISMFTPCLAFGQFGINARYQFISAEYAISKNAIQAGLEYHFRLKSNRIEFHPLLSYRRSLDNTSPDKYSSIDFDFNTSIYPFDFEGDCNCPTFSKQGTLIKKGFFFEIQPGIGLQSTTITNENEGINEFIYKIGLAIGLDIGLSDHITLTPFAAGTRHSPTVDGTYDRIAGGIRFTYSVDDKNRRRRN